MTGFQLGEQAAALDRGELPVVAGEDQFGSRLACRGQQFAGDAGIEHRRLVDDDDGAPAPLGAAVLQRKQRGVHGAGLLEPRGLQVLRHGIGRRQPDDAMPGRFVGLADHAQRMALAGAGPPFDQFQPAGSDRMHKRSLLVIAQPASLQHIEGQCQRHRGTARIGEGRGIGECVLFLFAHRPNRKPPCPLAGVMVVERHQFAVLEHLLFDLSAFGVVGEVLCQKSVEIARRKGCVVPGQRGQHLVGVTRGGLVGLADLLGAFDDLRPRHPHPHRADMRRRICRGRVDLEVNAVLAEIAVLVVPPQFAPGLALGDDRAPA